VVHWALIIELKVGRYDSVVIGLTFRVLGFAAVIEVVRTSLQLACIRFRFVVDGARTKNITVDDKIDIPNPNIAEHENQ
jgi:hypothetical protein